MVFRLAPPLDDSLPGAEWQRRRTMELAAVAPQPEVAAPRLSDQMPPEVWQRVRTADVSGAPGRTAPPEAPSAASRAPIDPARTPVFERGPDGKLQPVAGWHTTGPFDVGAWAHNIDWLGVVRDLGDIAVGAIGGSGKQDARSILTQLYGYGRAASDDAKHAETPGQR